MAASVSGGLSDGVPVLEELLPSARHRTEQYANNGSRPTTAG